MATDTHL